MLNDEIQLIVKMLLNKYPHIEKMEFFQLKYERIYYFKCSNNIKCFLLVKDSLIENYIAIFVKNGNYKANLNFPNKIYISNDLLIKSEEYYENNKLKFDYKIRRGVSTTSNAMYLIKMVGIEIE